MNTTFEAVLEDCVTGLDSEEDNDETERPLLEYAVTTICNGKMKIPLRWTADSIVKLGKVCECKSGNSTGKRCVDVEFQVQNVPEF